MLCYNIIYIYSLENGAFFKHAYPFLVFSAFKLLNHSKSLKHIESTFLVNCAISYMFNYWNNKCF